MNVFKYGDIPWSDPHRDAGGPSQGVKTKVLAQGESGFFVQSSWMPAGHRVEPHSHSADELFVVLEGGCTLDSGDELSPSDTAVFSANEVYGFTVGSAGMRFAVVRTEKASFRYATEQG